MRLERNQFQQLMHTWAKHHPYNAMDLVEVLRPADAQALRDAVASELQACGIAQLRDEVDGWHYEFVPGPAQPLIEIVTPPADNAPLLSLREYATAQINRPFANGPALPVRFGIVQCERGHFVTMTYQHWLFDGLTAGDLFRRILTRYLRRDCETMASRCDFHSPPLSRVLRRLPGRIPWTVAAIEIVQKVIRSKQSLLPSAGDWSDPQTQVDWLHAGDDGLLERIVAWGRRHRASVNEVLSALLADALAVALASEVARRRGRYISVGGVADLRRVVGSRLADAPGMFLGSFYLSCPTPLPNDLGKVVACLRRQMRRVKRRRLVLCCGLEFWMLRQLWSVVPSSLRDWYFTRVVPHTGGLSNLVYPSQWYAPLAGLLGQYWRAVPPGPLTTLALGVTTVGGRLSIELTTRRKSYSATQLTVFRERLLMQLRRLS